MSKKDKFAGLEPQDFNETMNDRMNYKNDSLSRTLVLLGIVLNCFYFIALYKNNHNFYYTYMMGVSILYNLIFMLTSFLAGENIKVYNRKFAYVVIALGGLQVVRIFIWPLLALTKNDVAIMTSGIYTKLLIYLVISATCLILGGISSIIKSKRLEAYNKKGE